MKKLGFLISLLCFGVTPVFSLDFSAGVAVSSDSIMGSFYLSPCDHLTFVLEGGPSFEREADFRVNDSCWHLGVEYAPLAGSVWQPYIGASYEVFTVDTSYTDTVAQGGMLGAGIAYSVSENHLIYMEGGWRYTRGTINSRYDNPAFEMYYSEEWRAPAVWVELGWRFSL